MQGAREFGDREIYDFAKARYDALGVTSENGARRWGGSVYANLLANGGRSGAEGAWNRFGHHDYPKAWLEGPRLESAPYPGVLMAFAASDGAALDLELVTGGSGGRFSVGFAPLRAGARYRASGAANEELTADARGRVSLSVTLAKRVPLRLAPGA